MRCSYDPATRGGNAPDGRKIKGTIHWVSALEGSRVEVRLYDRLFSEPSPRASDFLSALNPRSLELRTDAVVEPSVAAAPAGTMFQFERLGYYVVDSTDGDSIAINRAVTLRDTWAKVARKGGG